jgi:hypothetical protein
MFIVSLRVAPPLLFVLARGSLPSQATGHGAERFAPRRRRPDPDPRSLLGAVGDVRSVSERAGERRERVPSRIHARRRSRCAPRRLRDSARRARSRHGAPLPERTPAVAAVGLFGFVRPRGRQCPIRDDPSPSGGIEPDHCVVERPGDFGRCSGRHREREADGEDVRPPPGGFAARRKATSGNR